MLHEAVATSADRRAGEILLPFRVKRGKLEEQGTQWCGEKEVRDKGRGAPGLHGQSTDLCFLFTWTERESTSLSVSHLSCKPLDPQGELLSERRREAASGKHVQIQQCSAQFVWQPSSSRPTFLLTYTTLQNTTPRHSSKHLYSAALIPFFLPRSVSSGSRGSRGSAVRAQNSKVKVCRWKSRPLKPPAMFL